MPGDALRRNILFITTDQQRFDSLGCTGGQVARTPVVDALAAEGIRYRRAYANNTLCQPARSTLLTGLYPRTHGVTSNGIALPEDVPSVAARLAEAGYRTALIGKAHFEPGIDPDLRFREHRMPVAGEHGPWRGFEHVELALHAAQGLPGQLLGHYGQWLAREHPEHLGSFASLLLSEPGGETGAPETTVNPIPRDWYHTDWVADRTAAWLGTVNPDEPWFCWMSFPDPHHPWDPPAGERHRVRWQDLDLPEAWLAGEEGERVLATKPAHWLAYFQGRWRNAEGAPWRFRPTDLRPDHVREINAMTHVMCELIDEACGRVLTEVHRRGWAERTDVIFTTDHGELQGDYGFVFKGPFPVDALMRLPLVWRPAPVASVIPVEIGEPVSQVDLAPTFCAIAGLPVPGWMQGAPLPTAPGSGRERAITTWDSHLPAYGMHFATIYREGWLCTAYEPSTKGVPTGVEAFFAAAGMGDGPRSSVTYQGTEGECYDTTDDPHQLRNRWDDPGVRAWRDELVADLRAHLPPRRHPALPVAAPS